MCSGLALCAVAPALESLVATPLRRAAAAALVPFVLLALAVAMEYTSVEQVSEKANCVMSCSEMRGYAIGGVVLYLLAIKAAYNHKSPTLPKEVEGSEKPVPPVGKKAEGKLAAKAA